LTLARSGSAAPRVRREGGSGAKFERLQKQLAAMAASDFGTMTAREFFLYRSQLTPEAPATANWQAFHWEVEQFAEKVVVALAFGRRRLQPCDSPLF